MQFVVVALYCISLLIILCFSLVQFNLTLHYLKGKRNNRRKSAETPETSDSNLPHVTVQLPVYNEKYVVERLIDAVASFDYPKDRLEIQVLDDSNDETVEIIADKVEEWQAQGIDIQQVRRPERKGFKAGALQYGLDIAKGDLVAIFDADFMPDKDFLLKTAPQFDNEEIGVVQTRWGHLNKDYSFLTKVQAFGLDAHFSIEQSGRNLAGSFINFNGTAGVWRKSCIYEAGGWSADTLTEDLDLSYRAQMKGWKFLYLEDIVAPAELPVIMPAIKSQQYRWNKGAAETARKNLGKVLKSKLRFKNKIHAIFHLFNSAMYVGLLITSVLSIPMLFIKDSNPNLEIFFHLASTFLIGFLAMSYFYWVSSRQTNPNKTFKYYITTFPAFLAFSMGLSLHNAIAVLEGLLGFKSPFIRTPKFNIKDKKDSWKGNTYVKPSISVLTLLEGLFCAYFIFGIASGIYLHDWGLLFFHLTLTIGFGSIFYHSIKPLRYA
ncbi:MAG: cellulose synthase family protein [Bacteroidota bacterium]